MAHVSLIDLPTASMTALLLALFVAGATKGLIGVGMPIVAVPILSLVVDLPIAVALLSIPLIVTNVPQALQGIASEWSCAGSLRSSPGSSSVSSSASTCWLRQIRRR